MLGSLLCLFCRTIMPKMIGDLQSFPSNNKPTYMEAASRRYKHEPKRLSLTLSNAVLCTVRCAHCRCLGFKPALVADQTTARTGAATGRDGTDGKPCAVLRTLNGRRLHSFCLDYAREREREILPLAGSERRHRLKNGHRLAKIPPLGQPR